MPAKKKRRPQKGAPKKRGPGPVLAILLAGAVACWLGLVKVDRQIRAVTINQSPPLWETKEEGETLRLTLLGHTAQVNLSPLRAAKDEISLILQTPSAPERLFRELGERISLPPLPEYRPQETPYEKPRKANAEKMFA